MDTSCNEQLSENCNINEKDEFLILACDGLWDVFTNQVYFFILVICFQKKIRKL